MGLAIVAFVALGAAACSSATGTTVDTPDLAAIPTDPLILARPYDLRIPAGHDPSREAPLLVALHGYRATPFIVDAIFKMDTLVDQAGYLYATPAGTPDASGFPHWACCDGDGPDDVAYLDAVIADVSRRHRVDPRRVYILGHSNGAAMAYRYACDRATTVAAIVPIAGTFTTDPLRCAPRGPVSVLHVNGDLDPNWPGNPLVRESPVFWADRDGCSPTSDTSLPPMDFIDGRPGAETTVERWTGCRDGSEVALWVIGGQPHEPLLNPSWAPAVWSWLAAHPRP